MVGAARFVVVILQLTLVGALRIGCARVAERADIAGAGGQGGERGGGGDAKGCASGYEGRHKVPFNRLSVYLFQGTLVHLDMFMIFSLSILGKCYKRYVI